MPEKAMPPGPTVTSALMLNSAGAPVATVRRIPGSSRRPSVRSMSWTESSGPMVNRASVSFYHLVCAGEEGWWYSETKLSGSFDVHHEFEFCGLHNRQIAWPIAIKDSPCIDAHLT